MTKLETKKTIPIVAKSFDELHHGYIIEGERQVASEGVIDFLQNKLNFDTKGNPDFYLSNFETLSIEESRRLKELQGKRAFTGKTKVFVVMVDFITSEAQNSLLKIFEEPTEGTHFFLIIGNASRLLPTLRSRLHFIKLSSMGEDKEAKDFLCKSQASRLAYIKELTDRISDGELPKNRVIELLDSLEKIFYDKLSKGDLDSAYKIESIIKARSYAEDRSPSLKMLLENLAIDF
ncbi:MAG: hypothetical protein COV70_01460 [Parcubacteria group bacterium CG11_big_fil_rev_8_21_14_0_20_39_22]|nr:MAG: hypothetical protein COV70_01460 [Parcubacteria group bacterium CG11_big_fil_rev_8_21_14_0_20_39_22]